MFFLFFWAKRPAPKHFFSGISLGFGKLARYKIPFDVLLLSMVLAASFRASWQQDRTRCGYVAFIFVSGGTMNRSPLPWNLFFLEYLRTATLSTMALLFLKN